MRPTIALLLCACVAACASPPKDYYYTLAPMAPEGKALATPLSAAGITVVSSGLLETIDRPQLVMRASETQVQILEQQRWAEPLKYGIPRVVAANLARELGSMRVTAQTQAPLGNTAYRVALDVQRFDSLPGEAAVVEVSWTIRRVDADATVSGRSAVTERVAGGGYDALVAAHSRALATVSHEIAQALTALAARP
jgi:uncharacterized lipoprotein YmbA